MKAKSGFKAWLLYHAVRVVFMIMQVFPIDRNLRTARALARLWPMLMPRHRRRALAHLSDCYGQSLTPSQIRRIAERCLEGVAMFAVEAVCLPRFINATSWPRFIRLSGFEEALALFLDGRGAILVTGHYGSFELLGHLLACLGFRVSAVMRPLDNVFLNRFVVSVRRSSGLTLMDKKGAMTNAQAVLAEGGLLAFIGDQDAGRKGLFVDFFGRPASTYKSIGLLAMSTQCPIVVGFARRLENAARYDVSVQRIIHPVEWEGQEDPLRWITQTYTTAIEDFIRKEPEQYLWIHRRWKSQPGRKPRRGVRPLNSVVQT